MRKCILENNNTPIIPRYLLFLAFLPLGLGDCLTMISLTLVGSTLKTGIGENGSASKDYINRESYFSLSMSRSEVDLIFSSDLSN